MDVADQVHHVRVALDVHEVLHVDAPGHGRAPQVVTPQVHEHEVLGAFLWVGEQLVCGGAVLRGGSAAAARAGDGAEGAAALFQAHERLGRGTDEREVAVAEEEGVGRGVHRAQGAVELERLGAAVGLEALGEHHLDAFAVADGAFGRLDPLTEGLPGQVAAQARRLGLGRGPGQEGAGTEEGRLERGQAAQAVLIRRAGRGVTRRIHRRHGQDGVAQVVEDEQVVHQQEEGLWRLRAPLRRRQRLEAPRQLVPHEADRPAEQRRQALGLDRRAPQQRAQGLHRVAAARERPPIQEGPARLHREHPARRTPQEGVAAEAPPLPAALQQEAIPLPGRHPRQRAHRRLHVRQRLIRQRDGPPLCAQRLEPPVIHDLLHRSHSNEKPRPRKNAFRRRGVCPNKNGDLGPLPKSPKPTSVCLLTRQDVPASPLARAIARRQSRPCVSYAHHDRRSATRLSSVFLRASHPVCH